MNGPNASADRAYDLEPIYWALMVDGATTDNTDEEDRT